jgi:hypothetical protein
MFEWKTQSREQAKQQQQDNVVELVGGTHKFIVYGCESKMSKSNNNMVVVKQRVFLPGGAVFVDDALVDTPNMFFKRESFWKAVGGYPHLLNAVGDQYIKQEGYAEYKIEEYAANNGDMKKKLVVVKYIVLEEEPKSEVINGFTDDEIQF